MIQYVTECFSDTTDMKAVCLFYPKMRMSLESAVKLIFFSMEICNEEMMFYKVQKLSFLV